MHLQCESRSSCSLVAPARLPSPPPPSPPSLPLPAARSGWFPEEAPAPPGVHRGLRGPAFQLGVSVPFRRLVFSPCNTPAPGGPLRSSRNLCACLREARGATQTGVVGHSCSSSPWQLLRPTVPRGERRPRGRAPLSRPGGSNKGFPFADCGCGPASGSGGAHRRGQTGDFRVQKMLSGSECLAPRVLGLRAGDTVSR